jgi:hypothetical protein
MSLLVACPHCSRQTSCDFKQCIHCGQRLPDELVVGHRPARRNDQSLAGDSEAVLAKLDEPPATDYRAAFVRCPVCSKQLLRRNYERNADLWVHRCQGCGTFIERKPMMDLLWFLASHRSMAAGELAMDNKPVANTYRPPPVDPEVEHYNRMHLHMERLLDCSTPPPYDPCFGDPIRPPIRTRVDVVVAAVSLLSDLMLK